MEYHILAVLYASHDQAMPLEDDNMVIIWHSIYNIHTLIILGYDNVALYALCSSQHSLPYRLPAQLIIHSKLKLPQISLSKAQRVTFESGRHFYIA